MNDLCMKTKSFSNTAFIHSLAFFSGFVTLLLEIAGSRVIAPYYGSGLVVWTSVISMTIISLALGWLAGGYLSDKKNPLSVSLTACIVAGIWMSTLPWISQKLLEVSLTLPTIAGALTSFFAITGPVLICMGMLGPATLKIATSHLNVLGLSAGKIYLFSAAGSVLGTWITGFFLLPNLGTSNTIFTGAILLYLISGIGLLLRKHLRTMTFVAIIAATTSMITKPRTRDFLTPISQIEIEGLYGKIHLIDNFGRKKIYVNGILQGQSVIGSHDLQPLDLVKSGDLTELLPHLNPGVKDVLIIGVGMGTHGVLFSKHPYNLNVTYVDIDKSLVNLVNHSIQKIPPTIIGDGRRVLLTNNKKYDAIVLDAFMGESAPPHMCSKEFFQLVKQRLNPEGVFVCHHIGDPNGIATSSLYKTIGQSFDHVHTLVGGGVHRIRMIYFFASNKDMGVEQFIHLEMSHILGSNTLFEVDPTPGEIFTDDKCRFEEMQREDMKLWRQITRSQVSE